MLKTAKQIFDKGYQNLIDTRNNWVPNKSDQDMETVNHIYRVIIQNHDSNKFVEEFKALTEIQHEDGGWGNSSMEKKSHVRVTAFSTQMLLRANNDLPERLEIFDKAIFKGLNYLKANQKEDGTWFDEDWGLYDPVSVSVGTFMFALILDNVPQEIKELAEMPYKKGMDFIIRTQAEHGGWDYPEKYETPVCVTAHLLQKTISYGEIGKDISRKAMNFLINAQHSEGHYDNKNIDHTCDTLRALMLASELLNDYSSNVCIEKAMKWLLENRNEDDGWGDYAGDESNLLVICDGLDTMLKYIHYRNAYEKNIQKIEV